MSLRPRLNERVREEEEERNARKIKEAGEYMEASRRIVERGSFSYTYKGAHPDLVGETCLGQYDEEGFLVQVTGKRILGTSVPVALVDGEDWAHGWHRSPRDDWELFPDEPEDDKYDPNFKVEYNRNPGYIPGARKKYLKDLTPPDSDATVE